eukprot:11687065-Karenia_brevis.AAC.1
MATSSSQGMATKEISFEDGGHGLVAPLVQGLATKETVGMATKLSKKQKGDLPLRVQSQKEMPWRQGT